jgi:hypothetical protein
MTGTTPTEYHTLALDSSNEMMAHDSRRVLGRYAEAAWHAFRAGDGRRRMGVLMRQANNFTRAAADWLSASACFCLATNPGLSRIGLMKVRELITAGHIPPERNDIHEAVREREDEITNLEERLARFLDEYRSRYESAPGATPERLEFLREHVREFPGFAPLHFAIYREAEALGEREAAVQHLRWAAEFGADEPEYVGRYGYQLISAGQPALAATIARHFLTKYPREASIRVLLANSLVADGNNQDHRGALEELEPVLTDPDTILNVRLVAAGLSGALWRVLKDQQQAERMFGLFNQLSARVGSPAERARVSAVREVLAVPPSNGSEHPPTARDQLPTEPVRAELFPSDTDLTLTQSRVCETGNGLADLFPGDKELTLTL